ncbi:MAG: polysaccharide deacetylase family protein [Deltaproteobacteria bacterium]|nr:polysaccharide deacetylase family protein [Deltaproteobacteria bacterium]
MRRFAPPLGLLLMGPLWVGCESPPVVLWHSVGEPRADGLWVAVDALRVQLESLRDEGYTPVTVHHLDQILAKDAPAPARPVALTFDDGYSSFYDHAFPVLRELGFSATVFLISSRVGAEGYLSWEQIRELEAAGIEMESHTVTHRRLRDLGAAEQREEIVRSKAALEEGLGHPITSIAYPFGSNTELAHRAALEAGYTSGYSVTSGLNGPFDRLRVSVHAEHGLDDFRRMLGGSWWEHARDHR